MRFFLPAAFFLLFLSLSSAAGNGSANSSEPPPFPDVQNTLFVQALFSNGTPASQLPIVLLARSNKSDTVYRTITDPAGRFILSLGPGSHQIDALIDLPSTGGMDFASTAEFSVPHEGNSTLIFYPAGSLAGRALDAGSPVPGARIRVSCPSAAFDYSRINGGTQAQSGEAGDFLFRALPVGTCIISTSDGSIAGSVEAQVQPGGVSSVTVEMTRKSDPAGAYGFFYIAAAAVAVLALLAYFFARKKGGGKTNKGAPAKGSLTMAGVAKKEKTARTPAKQTRHAKPAKRPPGQNSEGGFDTSNPKASAVLSTLSEREREIAVFLLKSGGRAKRSQIQHKLLIPKTSLLRNLRSLERKNIAKLTPFGRNLLAEIDQSLFS